MGEERVQIKIGSRYLDVEKGANLMLRLWLKWFKEFC